MDSDPATASQKLQTDLLVIQNWFKKNGEWILADTRNLLPPPRSI
jgi:hypothetical protein